MAELRLGENIIVPAIVVGGDEIRNQDKTITENGQYTADDGYTGLGKVTVNVPSVEPTGTINITQNGNYDVAQYANANVNVPTGEIPVYIPPRAIVNGVLRNPNTATSYSLGGATNVSSYALTYAFISCSNLTSLDLSSLTTVSGSSAMNFCFFGCNKLTSLDLSSLTTLSGDSGMSYCFSNCTGLTSVDLSSLTTVSGSSVMSNCFASCTNLTSVDFPSLTTVAGTASYYTGMMTSCFSSCSNITSVSFPVLATLGSTNAMGGCFQYCKALPKISFPALTTIHNQAFGSASYNWCFGGCTALTEIHFRADAREAVEATAGYAEKWGATNATIYFDL